MRTMYRVQTAQTFLSTPSARRATLAKFDEKTGLFISIHALREEGDSMAYRCVSNWRISIHALREEGDLDFYYPVFANLGISIHALREEGDSNRN